MEQEPKPADIRFLPTDGLVVPDWNPRKTMSESGLAALEAYVKAGGTIPRIWVWGGDGKSVISGQRRLTVYRRLGKPLIEAEILHVSLEEAQRLARSSNRGDALNWLEEYESWEHYLTPNPQVGGRGLVVPSRSAEVNGGTQVGSAYFQPGSKLTDAEIGALEGVNEKWIGRARALLAVLNPASRKLIRESLAEIPPDEGMKNKGNNDVSQVLENIKKPLKKRISKSEKKRGLLEDTAFPLTSLWNKRTIQEAQALVEKALPVILARQMKGPQVKALVKWVSVGNDPEEFGKLGIRSEELGVKAEKKAKPEVATSATAPIGAPPRNDIGNDDLVKEHLSPGPQAGGQGLVVPSRGGDGIGATKAGSVPDLHSQVGTVIAGHELGKRLHLPTQLVNRLLPGLTRLFHRARGLLAGLGIQNPTWATFLTLLLFLFVGNALIHLTGRLMNGLWHGVAPFSPSPIAVALAPTNRGPQLEASALPNSLVPQESQFVKTFLEKALSPDPDVEHFMHWMDYLHANLTPDAQKPFNQAFYPRQKFNQIADDYLRQTFQLTQPVTCLSQGPEGDLFQAQGLLITKGGSKNPSLSPTTLLKTFRVDVLRSPQGKLWVGNVGL